MLKLLTDKYKDEQNNNQVNAKNDLKKDLQHYIQKDLLNVVRLSLERLKNYLL